MPSLQALGTTGNIVGLMGSSQAVGRLLEWVVRAVSCPEATSRTTSANGVTGVGEPCELRARHGDEHAELAQIVGGDPDLGARLHADNGELRAGQAPHLEREFSRLVQLVEDLTV